MNLIQDLERWLTDTFTKQEKYKARKMKRIFQWRRYLDWQNLSAKEKLTTKRLLFIPIIAFFIISFIQEYAFTIIFLICGYLAYKKFEKKNLTK